jgi:alkylhydroperoxidase family enzyme
MARVAPIPFREWPPEMRSALAALESRKPRHPKPAMDGISRAGNVSGTLAHHPALARAFFALQGHLLTGTTLTLRHREMLILRVMVVRKSPYEFSQHQLIAPATGLDAEQIARVAFGPDAPFWSDVDAALLRAVDELIIEGAMSEDTWNTLAIELDTQQIFDVMFTVSGYDAVSRLLRSCQVAIDDDVFELREEAGWVATPTDN